MKLALFIATSTALIQFSEHFNGTHTLTWKQPEAIPGQKKLKFGAGNYRKDKVKEVGIYASDPDTKYAISYKLD